MHNVDPINQPKSDFADLIAQISLADSPVGIDAKYTHALIVKYLQEILKRVERLESQLAKES